MRFTVEHSAFAPALSAIARVIPSRSVRPILSSVLIRASDGGLTLCATDLDTTAVTTVPATIQAEGSAALPARYLTEMVRRIPGGTLSWDTADSSAAAALITWERSEFRINAYDANEFPPVPTFPSDPVRALPQGELRHAIAHSAFAAAQGDTARALLTGVELRFGDAALFALATDGFQAAAYTTQPDAVRPVDDAVVVPAPVLQDVAKLLIEPQEPCEIAHVGNQILFRAGSTYLAARLLEGRYFPILDLVPKDFPTRAHVEREALLGACERVGLVAEQPPHAVVVELGSTALRITSSSAEIGAAAESVDAAVEGESVHVGFNVRQLAEGLRRFEGAAVDLEISGPSSLARVTEPQDGRLQFLQMPLQMPDNSD